MNGRHADSVLQVQLLPAGGYRLALLGPEPRQHTHLLRHRLPGLQPFVQVAERQLRRLGHHQASFVLQLHDEQPRPLCFRFDAPLQADGLGPLIPDPYVLASEGYASLRARFASEPLPPWHERLPVAIWRGSSTGSAELTLAKLAENRRYQLCRRSLELPHRLNARLSALVQCPDPAGVGERLHREGLLAPRLDPWHLALHRWIVEIDGNVTREGCCGSCSAAAACCGWPAAGASGTTTGLSTGATWCRWRPTWAIWRPCSTGATATRAPAPPSPRPASSWPTR